MITGNMGNARALAEQLRQMGRGKDTMLAHITPEEADMLLQAGGSGSINPMTGLPEFQPMYDFGYGDMPSEEFEQLPDMVETTPSPQFNIQPYTPLTYLTGGIGADTGAQGGFQELPFTPRAAPRAAEVMPVAPMGQLTTREVAPIPAPGVLERLKTAGKDFEKFADENKTLTRLGGAGVNIGLAALLARRAGREREAYARDLRGMAQQYAQAQQEALARAQGGGMTAPQQRAFDIAQARARQVLSAQNLGAGSAAAGIQSAQAQRARTMARQESFDAALDAAKIRDSYLREAARQELAADTDLANALIGVLQGEIREATTTQASAPQQQRRP